MKILITGASGFVGNNLVQRLLKENHQLTVMSTGSENEFPKEIHQNKKHKILYYSFGGIDWKYINNQDAVIHLSANNDTRCQDENEMMRTNYFGPIQLFTKAARNGCTNFVYASSTAVYGNEPAPYIEDVTLEKPLNVYGESKKQFDKFAMKFAEERSVKVIGLRYCNVYGPGESHKGKRMSMIGQILRKMMSGKKPTLFYSGKQKRDWVYVEDVVDANILSLASNKSNIYNIGTGVAVSFNELVYEISQILDTVGLLPPNYIDCPFEDEYQSYTCCNIEKAKSHLGFNPKYDLATGLKNYLECLNKT